MNTPNRPELNKCLCSLRIRLTGDGCQYCNPELAAWYRMEEAEEDAVEGKHKEAP